MPEDQLDAGVFAFSGQTSMAAGVSTLGSHQNPLAGEARELASLLQISKALAGTSRLKAGITEALEILERDHGAIRSSVTLLREGSQELCIEASVGLSSDGQAVRYLLGEGVTGRVVQTGKPVVVPQASREPMFLNRAGQRRYSSAWEITFVCVPILIHRKPRGQLERRLAFDKDRDYDRTVNFFGVVASMIAQAVQIHCLIDADRRRLLEENVHLREELRSATTFRISSAIAARSGASTSR